MPYRFFLFVLPIFFGACTYTIKNVMIHDGPAVFGPEEPSICIDPNNPKRVVAGANINHVFYSKDGGHTWKAERLKSEEHGVYGDPCIINDGNGRFYFFHLSNPDGKGWASDSLLDRIVCQYSDDGGLSWNDGSAIGLNAPKDQDKEWAVVDPRTGHIYITWTQFDLYNSKEPGDSSNIMFSKSTDRGETWSKAIRINQKSGNCLDDDNTAEGAVPAVGPNGEIYVSWSLGEKIYFNKSLDGGETWLDKDLVVANHVDGWVMEIPGLQRCNGMPVTCCDLSDGPNRGTIYVNWCDTRNGRDNSDVWLCKSTDGGNTWSEPHRVNTDSSKKHQFLTWMDVDQSNGDVYTVFYDRRAHNDLKTDVYLAYSSDGGESFENVEISDSSFTPHPLIFFGDYNNISVVDGQIRPIWTRLANGRIGVWTAIIDKKRLK